MNDDTIKIQALEKALTWFVDRQFVIQPKFDLYGPQDTAKAMRIAYIEANDALAMVRS